MGFEKLPLMRMFDFRSELRVRVGRRMSITIFEALWSIADAAILDIIV